MLRLDRRAFTLIEMLIVIAIIAILAALLAPALRKALLHARGAACMAGPAKAIGHMIGLYANDYNGYVPPTMGGGKKGKKWHAAFRDAGYVTNGEAIWCPSLPIPTKASVYNEMRNITSDRTAFGSTASQIYQNPSHNNSYMNDYYRFRKLLRPDVQIFAADSGFDLSQPYDVMVGHGIGQTGDQPNCYLGIRPDASGLGSSGFYGRFDARHLNEGNLIHFGGSVGTLWVADRSQPWLGTFFGSKDDDQNPDLKYEYKRRCSNDGL